MNRYKPYFNEDIVIPLNKNDKFFYGKFKNKTAVYDSHYINEKGDIVIVTPEGKEIPMAKIRLMTESISFKGKTLLLKNMDKAPNMGSKYGQDVEPAGFYCLIYNENYQKNLLEQPNYKLYSYDIHNPLIIDVTDNVISWKKELSEKYKAKGKSLSNKLIKEGYDCIITYDSKYNETGEVIILKTSGLKELVKENLRISDLKKHAGISDFTKPFMKDRQKIKGTGAKSAKIKSMKINRKADYITFTFTSIPTYTKTAMAVSFPDVDKEKRVRAYTQEIRILDFFALAETKPGYVKNEISPQEIKEILNVADVKLSCNCKSYQLQGFNAILTTFDASIYPELRLPKRWDKLHKDDSLVCKHLSILITSGLNIYINNMSSMVTKYLKGQK